MIPVKNGYPEIKDCIEGLLSQTVKIDQILVVDSGSTDGTLEYLRTIKEVKLIDIDPADFNHGDTRNLGWQYATAEYLFYTVQDARPVNEFLLEELLKGFTDDDVAGVCGQQVVPHDLDKNPVEWFKPFSEPLTLRYRFKTPGEFEKLLPEQKKSVCSWDDVVALYKRTALQEIPFQRILFGEDMLWAKDALLHGFTITYRQAARVYHYHLENSDFTFKRSFTTMYFRYKHFGFLYEQPQLPVWLKLSMLKTLATATGWNPVAVIKWYQYNTGNFRAGLKAYRLFMKHLQQGDASLDAAHEQYCGKPPVPQKAIQ